MRYDANTFLENLFREPPQKEPVRPGKELDDYDDVSPDDLPADWRFKYEERIALMQPDENPPLEHVEAAAFADTLRRMRAAGIDPRSPK